MNKKDLLKAMHKLVLAIGDEDITDTWLIDGMGDFPSEGDFDFVANNEDSFRDTVALFIKMSKYFKDGLYLFGKWYK